MKLGQAMYESQQAEGGAAEGDGPADDDNVVDADFEDVSDDKNKSA
jgi:molecular chaperone DnaK